LSSPQKLVIINRMAKMSKNSKILQSKSNGTAQDIINGVLETVGVTNVSKFETSVVDDADVVMQDVEKELSAIAAGADNALANAEKIATTVIQEVEQDIPDVAQHVKDAADSIPKASTYKLKSKLKPKLKSKSVGGKK